MFNFLFCIHLKVKSTIDSLTTAEYWYPSLFFHTVSHNWLNNCIKYIDRSYLFLFHFFYGLCKQTAVYNPQMASYYHQQLYGPTSPPTVGHPPYHCPPIGYLQTARAGFPSHYMQYPAPHMEGTFIPSSSQQYPLQLQPPPHARQPLNTTEGNTLCLLYLCIVTFFVRIKLLFFKEILIP